MIICYCGLTVPEDRLHYPGNNPEDGRAHKPQPGVQCHSCGEILTDPVAYNMHELAHYAEEDSGE